MGDRILCLWWGWGGGGIHFTPFQAKTQDSITYNDLLSHLRHNLLRFVIFSLILRHKLLRFKQKLRVLRT